MNRAERGLNMGRVKTPELKPVSCYKCNRFLAWVPVDSVTFCPRCSVWNNSEGGRHVKPKGKTVKGKPIQGE